MSSLDNLKKEAKRWLKALRAGDADARERLRRADPNARATPGLRHVQHALARERGYASWIELTAALQRAPTTDPDNAALSALLDAADAGQTDRLIEILDRHPDLINRRGLLPGHTGLRTALHFGVHHEPIVRVLLERGADPNIRDEGDNAMPLHFAAEKCNLPVVQLLIEHGADPIGTGDGHELDVIGWATCFGPAQTDVVDYLLAHGAVHNIFSAIAVGAVEAIEAIVRRSPGELHRRMDATNHRRSVLHLAVVKNQPAALRTLLDLRAERDVVDAAGLTALDQAGLSGETALADILIEHGAALGLPAALALERMDDVERLLRDDPGALTPGNRWAGLIVRASERGSAALIESLIRHGAAVNVRDDTHTSVDSTSGYTALHAAGFHGNAAAARVLLDHGADPTIREDKYCATPAGWADYAGHADVRDLILGGPIDLFEAIDLDRSDRIPEILERDPEALNRPFVAYAAFSERRDGSCPDPETTPLDRAIVRERSEAVRLLTARGAAVKTMKRPEESSERSDSERRQLVATFLEFACWDHHVHGTSDHQMYAHAALRILRQHPWIARDSIYTAIVCGDLPEVQRILAERPDAAKQSGGARGWEPILYLSYARIPHQPTIDNAVAIAAALLDRGANPNAFYMAGDSSYTALVGAAAQGEQDAPRQPQSAALFRLLLERGAEPFDIQVLYNTHFNCDMIWWLDLVYEHTVSRGRKAEWDDPDWTMLDMGGYGPGAFFILNAAIERNAVEVVKWALAHGANPNVPESSNPKFKPSLSLYDAAMIQGATEIADLLASHGAVRRKAEPNPEQAFVAACFRLDREAARALVGQHPKLLRSTDAIFTAARRNRPDVVAMLLDLGVPIDIASATGETALHAAAGSNALEAAKLLVERGASVDPHESTYDSPPLGFALHFWHEQTMEFLAGISRDILRLTFMGKVERVRELLRAEPELATVVAADGTTPLWWLPSDEARALELVDLLLAHGADPSVRVKSGRTAADWARRRGMLEVARRLAVDDGGESAPAPPPLEGLAKYERVAQNLVLAYETGQPAAMQHLREHFDAQITWNALREGVRQHLDALAAADRPEGAFGLPHAKLLIARHAGFSNWNALVASLRGEAPSSVPPASRQLDAPELSARMVRPPEMQLELPVRLHDGARTTTTEVWAMLTATLVGDLDRVRSLVEACPSLVRCDYNYMPPLHLAVRERHRDLVRYLAERGAVNPKHVTYPYKETLLTIALDRADFDIVRILEEHLRVADRTRSDDESGEIEYGRDPERRRFEALVGASALAAVEAMLKERPDLATNPLASNAEGILSGPANRRNHRMLELLVGYGARVPDVSKWGRAYYFKHADVAAFLLKSGMNPNHMNCHRTTLLHDMAWEGNREKALLLIDHGADINAVDEEFRSTPLGVAARFGRADVAALLIERGADPAKAGAPWATPLAWARRKGHERLVAMLTAQ